jgi:hypothetical protein
VEEQFIRDRRGSCVWTHAHRWAGGLVEVWGSFLPWFLSSWWNRKQPENEEGGRGTRNLKRRKIGSCYWETGCVLGSGKELCGLET